MAIVPARPIPEGAFQKVEPYIHKTRKCWLWKGTISPNGYGVLNFKGKNYQAHRVVYSKLVTDIPPELRIDHLCRVRHCVNPKHLQVVSNRENVLRGVGPTAHNARKSHCENGHAFTPQNTRIAPHNNQRICKACRARFQSKWRGKYTQRSHNEALERAAALADEWHAGKGGYPQLANEIRLLKETTGLNKRT